jgi:hypothetical protein
LTEDIGKRWCGICGKRLRKGGNNYRMKLEIISDFDGHLSVPYDENRKYEDEMKELIDKLGDIPAEELEEEVYYGKELLICAQCRKALIHQFSTGDNRETSN